MCNEACLLCNFAEKKVMISNFISMFWGDIKEVKVLILGCEFAGKTTFLYRMLGVILHKTIPTIGYILETLTYKNIKFNLWEIEGYNIRNWKIQGSYHFVCLFMLIYSRILTPSSL
jgi:GTPase SAR1 family protein